MRSAPAGDVVTVATRQPPPFAATRQQARLWWTGRQRRERQALALLAAVLGLFAVWTVLVQPAWRSVVDAPAQIDRLDAQLREMQRTAAESQTLRGAAPVAAAQAALALKSATDRLGERAKLTQRGDRATLTFTGLSPDALRAWLSEARSGARARPVEVQWQRAAAGYSGTLTVSIGATP